MRLVTLQTRTASSAGLLFGDSVLNIEACRARFSELADVPNGLAAILATGAQGLDALRRFQDRLDGKPSLQAELRTAGSMTSLDASKLLAPIPDPTLILSCGMNYHEHLKEMKTPVPATPTAFTKNAASVIGPGEAIVLPPDASDMVDWEGEFSIVIGKPCHRVKASRALEYVAGYTIINDVSARDWVAPVFASSGTMGAILAWEHNLLGKQFPTFCPMGPLVATADELPNPYSLQLTTRLNGMVVQSTSTSDLVFDVPTVIEYFSRFYKLRANDIITTGSPSGVGYGRNPKLFMKAGDVIEVEVEGIGVLRNPVVSHKL